MTALYKIVRRDRKWLHAEDGWVSYYHEASVFSSLPKTVTVTDHRESPFAVLKGKVWVYEKQIIARAVHEGG